jgi:hypothetical protein
MTYAERQEMNKASKKYLGKTSRWQKLMNGIKVPVSPEEAIVLFPKHHKDPKSPLFKKKYFTLEEVKSLIYSQIEGLKALEEQKAKEEALKKVNENATGNIGDLKFKA